MVGHRNLLIQKLEDVMLHISNQQAVYLKYIQFLIVIIIQKSFQNEQNILKCVTGKTFLS